MARGLIGAAMLSGAGQGLANAAGTGIQIYGTMMLQQQREQMEERKLKLMEQFASEREQRGYQHQDETLAKTQEFQRGLEQERRGADIVLRAQEREAQSNEKALDRSAASQQHADADATTRRGQDITAKHGQAVVDATIAHSKATEAHQKALEGIYRAHYANDRDKVKSFITDEKGTYFALTESGETKPVLNPITKEPITGQKGLSEASKELSKLSKERGDAYYKLAGDAMASPDDKAKYQQLGELAYQQAGSYLGEKPKAPAGSVQIKDRFASQQGGQSSPQPSVPAADDISQKPMARGERTVPAATVTASPTDALSEGFGKVVDRTKGLIANATDALMPSPVVPEQGVTRESKADAMASIKGNTSELLAQKREETAQRAAAVMPEESPKKSSSAMGLLDSAQAASPKKAARPPAGTSGLEWAQSLPPEDQQSLRRIIAEYQAGKRTRDEFISGVISMSESGTQGIAIAEGMLRNLDRGSK